MSGMSTTRASSYTTGEPTTLAAAPQFGTRSPDPPPHPPPPVRQAASCAHQLLSSAPTECPAAAEHWMQRGQGQVPDPCQPSCAGVGARGNCTRGQHIAAPRLHLSIPERQGSGAHDPRPWPSPGHSVGISSTTSALTTPSPKFLVSPSPRSPTPRSLSPGHPLTGDPLPPGRAWGPEQTGPPTLTPSLARVQVRPAGYLSGIQGSRRTSGAPPRPSRRLSHPAPPPGRDFLCPTSGRGSPGRCTAERPASLLTSFPTGSWAPGSRGSAGLVHRSFPSRFPSRRGVLQPRQVPLFSKLLVQLLQPSRQQTRASALLYLELITPANSSVPSGNHQVVLVIHLTFPILSGGARFRICRSVVPTQVTWALRLFPPARSR